MAFRKTPTCQPGLTLVYVYFTFSANFSSTRVEFFMEFFQPVLVDMGVDLGRGDVGMAQHDLHGAQVGAVGQEVGGKGVAQHVRRDGLADSGCLRRFLDDLPEPEPGHGAAPVADKKDVAASALEDQWAGGLEVVLNDFPGRDAKGDEPFLVALADHPDKAGGEVAGGKGDGNQLRNPDAGGVQEMEHGVVSLALGGDDGGRGQQSGDLTHGQGLGEAAAGPWQVDGGKGVVVKYVVCQQETKKTFEGGDPSGVAAVGKVLLAALFQKNVQGGALYSFQR